MLPDADDGDWWGLRWLIPPVLTLGACALALSRRSSVGFVVALILSPLLALGSAAILEPIRADQREAVAAFNVYAMRFPNGYLERVGVAEWGGFPELNVVCGVHYSPSSTPNSSFCANIDLAAADGKKVVGGFRWTEEFYNRRDCFGIANEFGDCE